MTPLLRTARILRRVLETWGDLLSLNSSERPSANADLKNSKGDKNNNDMDFAVSPDHWVKLKESEKKDKYLDIARELKKLWNMKVTSIPIVIGPLTTITKRLVRGLETLEIRDRVETIYKALLRSARILSTVLERRRLGVT